jgi:hypothetical protein
MTFQKMLPLAAVAAYCFAFQPAMAGEKCYDFSKMTVGKTYKIGDEIDISIGKVRIREFIKNGEVFKPVNDVEQSLSVSQSVLAQGESSPELAGRLVGVQLIPREPVQEISMLVAQQLGLNANLPAYVEVNGELHDFTGSFNIANNKELGDAASGRARFKAKLVQDAAGPDGPSYWHRGRMGVRAVNGGIATATFGAQIFNFDQVCFKK